MRAGRIMILGDYNPGYYTHIALNDTIVNLMERFENQVSFDWVGTDLFDLSLFGDQYHGLFIASGSPYTNGDMVLKAIEFARMHDIPTYGNCGGYQHMIIEFARNVCLLAEADTEETNPGGDANIISRLSCSLVEEEENIHINESTQLYSLVGFKNMKGKYHCNFNLNEKYRGLLEDNGLKMSAFNDSGEVRGFELPSHPFFIGTLFQPALTSESNAISPILTGFVERTLESCND